MNEGFTMFIERKICGRLVSEEYRQFMSFNGWTNNLIPAVSVVEFERVICAPSGILLCFARPLALCYSHSTELVKTMAAI